MNFYGDKLGGFYETDLITMQVAIKEIEEKPTYTLQSYKLYLEKRIEERKEQIGALRQGKPAIGGRMMSRYFFRAMGFVEYDDGRMTGQRGKEFSGAMAPLALKEKAAAMGLPIGSACDECCKLPAAIEAGQIPMEPLIECDQHSCPLKALQKVFIATKWAQPIFHFDIPSLRTEASLEYIVDQLRQFIEVAEKMFPSVIKYDEDKLIEYQARHETMLRYNHEIYEMTKHQPSPISGWDAVYGRDWVTSDPEYCRARRDEIAERVVKGIAAVPGEKLRACWVSRINWFDAFKVLAKYQIASPIVYQNLIPELAPWWPRPAYYGGRKLTPLEEVAAYALERAFACTADVFVDSVLRVCRELKIDGIVYIEQIGCVPLLGFKRWVVDRAERDLGIPTVLIEAAEADSSYVDKVTITTQLDEFAQMLLSQRGLA